MTGAAPGAQMVRRIAKALGWCVAAVVLVGAGLYAFGVRIVIVPALN
jgi:hypothetical protein